LKWFKHDSDSRHDAKIQKLRLKYGLEGYGLYFFLLECVAGTVDSHNLTFELEEDAELVSAATNIHIERVEEMMRYMVNLGLFESDGGRITCLKMALRTDEYTQHLMRKMNSLPIVSGQTPDGVGIKSELREQNRTEQKRTEQKTTRASRARFCKPTVEEVADYCAERNNEINPQAFVDYYEANGWKVGRNPMKDWKASVRTWEQSRKEKSRSKSQGGLSLLKEIAR